MAKVFQSTTYPGSASNDPSASSDSPVRDLSIINQPAGYIEFCNTEGIESMTLAHKSGAMLQFNNEYMGIFSPKGSKSQIMGDSFAQVNGKMTIQADEGIDMVQSGDSHDKTGNVSKYQEAEEEYLEKLKPVHNKKRLFEIKRVAYKNFIDQAPEQTKSGKLAKYPLSSYETKTLYTVTPTIYTPYTYVPCDDVASLPLILEAPETEYSKRKSLLGKSFNFKPEDYEKLKDLSDEEIKAKILEEEIEEQKSWYCLTSWGTGESPSSQDGEWDKEALKDEIENDYATLSESMIDTEKKFGSGNSTGGTKVVKTGKNKVEIVGTSFNSMESYRIDPLGKLVQYGVKIDPFGSGVYIQHRESPLIEAVHVDSGTGGDYVQTIGDKWAVNVGSNGIQFKTTGQFSLFGSIVNIIGESVTIHSRNEVCLGAERVDIEGEIITIRPRASKRKIEDSSGNERTLDANGKDETEQERHALVDGNLNISQNLIVKGGTHIEGELSVQHITAPAEYQITETDFETGGLEVGCEGAEKTVTHGDMIEGKIIGKLVGTDVVSVACENAIMVHPHYHYFKNIPLKLFDNVAVFKVKIGDKEDEAELTPNNAVRAIGARNNFDKPVLAKPIKNSESNTTVVEKFGGYCEESPVNIVDGAWKEEVEVDMESLSAEMSEEELTAYLEELENADKLEDDILPSGSGIASEEYRQTKLSENKKELEETLLGKYKDHKELLAKTSQNTKEARIRPKGLA